MLIKFSQMVCHTLPKFELNGIQSNGVVSTSFELISSKVSYVFSPKNFRNSFRDPRPHFLACSIPRIVTALRHLGILFAPKDPSTCQILLEKLHGAMESLPATSSTDSVRIRAKSSSENFPSAPLCIFPKFRFEGSLSMLFSHLPRPWRSSGIDTSSASLPNSSLYKSRVHLSSLSLIQECQRYAMANSAET